MSKDLQLAIHAAKEAGELIRKKFGERNTFTRKGVNNFVTETDRQSEKIIIDHLAPTGYAVLGEETGEKMNTSTKKWIIDPIDGTTNFIRGIPFFAVSIALIEDNTELLVGVVYNPITDECYYAERHFGSYLNIDRINVSREKDFDGSLILAEYGRSEQSKKEYLQALTQLMQHDGAPVLRQGSTALMLCYVAKGSADAFLSVGDEIYDYAAGMIIAREAGALITDWKGKPWKNENSYILATNKELHRKVVKRLSRIP